MFIYSVRDSKAEAFLKPFFAQKDAIAIRWLTAAAQDPEHEFNIHIEDYALYRLGEFDESTGEIIPQDPSCLTLLVHLLKTEEYREQLPLDKEKIKALPNAVPLAKEA